MAFGSASHVGEVSGPQIMTTSGTFQPSITHYISLLTILVSGAGEISTAKFSAVLALVSARATVV